MRASARPVGGLAHLVEIGEHTLVVDASADAGGDSSGPTPNELITGALASCAAMTMRMYGRRKGWDVDDVEVLVEAQSGERGGCAHFEVTLRLPQELSDEQVHRLRVIASRCPVHRTLASAEPCVIEDRVERI